MFEVALQGGSEIYAHTVAGLHQAFSALIGAQVHLAPWNAASPYQILKQQPPVRLAEWCKQGQRAKLLPRDGHAPRERRARTDKEDDWLLPQVLDQQTG